MNFVSALWNRVPDIRGHLPERLGGRAPVAAAPQAAASEKFQELQSTLQALQPAAWQEGNSWSPLMKIQKTLAHLRTKPDQISTDEWNKLNTQFNGIKGPEDADLPAVPTLLQQLREAKSRLRESETPENQYQVALAEYNLERGRVNVLGGTTNEERSFARLLASRNELRFAIQIHKPEVSDYKLLLNLQNHEIPYPLRGVVETYKNAITAHGNQVMDWIRTQDESSIQLLDRAQHEAQTSANPFVWKGREEVLIGRVELINTHIVQQFDTFFNTYQTEMKSQHESTLKELFPERYEKGFWNSFVRQVVLAWESVFGNQDNEARNDKIFLANALKTESKREKPKTVALKDDLFTRYSMLRGRLSGASIAKIDQARDAFNHSIRTVLDGERLEHYFQETTPANTGLGPYTLVR